MRTQYEQGEGTSNTRPAPTCLRVLCPGRSKKEATGRRRRSKFNRAQLDLIVSLKLHFTLGHILLPMFYFRLDHPLSNIFTLDRYFYH